MNRRDSWIFTAAASFLLAVVILSGMSPAHHGIIVHSSYQVDPLTQYNKFWWMPGYEVIV